MRLFKYIGELVDLRIGVDKYGTIEEIKNKKSMSGANAWMLMCSIMIASIGLNLNSAAVIIGAMLISPLMSPILGVGLAVGINDRDTLKKALRHFSAAMAIAILTSTIYFFFSPFGEITSEIEARTAPTILDVLIAVFGGIAGIVSIARKDISTTLPGVAIATALMPPLCVCGYGIANGQWQFALSSFYLFFLNSFFVALATYLIVRYLQFPYKKYVNKTEKRRNIMYTTVFALVVLAPSLYIFSDVLADSQRKVRIQSFIQEYIGDDQIFLDDYEFLPSDSTNRLILKVYGDNINSEKVGFYKEGLLKHRIHDTKLEIIPTSEIKLDKLAQIESQINGMQKIARQLEAAQTEKAEQEKLMLILENQLDQLSIDSSTFNSIAHELKAIHPSINEVYAANLQHTDFYNYYDNLPCIILELKPKSRSTKEVEEDRVYAFLKARLQIDTLKLIVR